MAAWMRAMADVRSSPKTAKAYRALVEAHSSNFANHINRPSQSLPWHRWQLLQLENLLHEVAGCEVSMLYVDFGKIAANWDTSLIWSNGRLGGSGDPAADSCISRGTFQHAAFKLTSNAATCVLTGPEKCCLQRNFSTSLPFLYATQVETLLRTPPSEYARFAIALDTLLAYPAHMNIGGTMRSKDAAQAPEFFLNRAYVDYVWWRYLQQSDAHREAAIRFYGDTILNFTISGNNAYPDMPGTAAAGVSAHSMLVPGSSDVCIDYQWNHKAYENILTRREVDKLSLDEQWEFLEHKLLISSTAHLLGTPGKPQGSWSNLPQAFKLFNAPLWERIIAFKVLKNSLQLNQNNHTLNENNLLDRLSGLYVESVLVR
ncbi:uncharacterized protein LOC135805190 [Sycon ciliatum]|uniref:uncharacterized protein LOC135805190 n=1 Tax=Sycon ciliatum TaxID=27933 RepID=UPI0031F69F01